MFFRPTSGRFSHISLASTLAACLFAPSVLLAQKTAAPSAAAGSVSGSNVGSGSRGGTYGNNIPGTTNSPTQSTFDRPMFFSGRVQFDDGSPANTEVKIQRVCGASTRTETHTDSKGRFAFQLGQSTVVDSDASNDSVGSFGRANGPSTLGSTSGFGGSRLGDTSRQLWNCELRAEYPGYRSDTVRLAGRQALDPPDVGTIVLHHIGNVQGSTISLTTALAPKNAQRAYQKGIQLADRGKFEDAEQRLREATNLYPKYAIAWYALARTQERNGQSADAQKSYQAAIAADSHYVSPYDQLARLAAQSGNWQQAADLSKQVISMNSVEFPSSLWYNAVASYQLKKPADAEQSVAALLKLDTRHEYPQAENLIGQLLLEQGKYPDAATHLRSFLTLVPKAENANTIRQVLEKIDGSNALTKAAPPQQ